MSWNTQRIRSRRGDEAVPLATTGPRAELLTITKIWVRFDGQKRHVLHNQRMQVRLVEDLRPSTTCDTELRSLLSIEEMRLLSCAESYVE